MFRIGSHFSALVSDIRKPSGYHDSVTMDFVKATAAFAVNRHSRRLASKEPRVVTLELNRIRTLEGSLATELLRFGSPLAVGMGLQVTFNLVDAYLVSRLGSGEAGAALGAIGICDQIAAIGSIISFGSVDRLSHRHQPPIWCREILRSAPSRLAIDDIGGGPRVDIWPFRPLWS